MGWFSGMSDIMNMMRDCTPGQFPEKRRGWCTTNTPDDRRRRKDRARELTRMNAERKGEAK